jgi:hypothetical protein
LQVIPTQWLYARTAFKKPYGVFLPENPLTLSIKDKGSGSSSGIKASSIPFLTHEPVLWVNKGSDEGRPEGTKESGGPEPAHTVSTSTDSLRALAKTTGSLGETSENVQLKNYSSHSNNS